MTVLELKALLAPYPDDMEIKIVNEDQYISEFKREVKIGRENDEREFFPVGFDRDDYGFGLIENPEDEDDEETNKETESAYQEFLSRPLIVALVV